MLLMVFLEPPLMLFISLGVTSSESNLSPFLFCFVIDGLLPNHLGLPNVPPCVFESTLVLPLALNITFKESNPPPPTSFFVVLLMVFFLGGLGLTNVFDGFS